MAFQFKDDEGDKLRRATGAGGPPQPILHKPKITNPFLGRIIFAFCALVVLAAAGFLMHKAGLFRTKENAAPAVEQVVPLQTPTPDVATADSTMTMEEQVPQEILEPVQNEPVRTRAEDPAPSDTPPAPPVKETKKIVPAEKQPDEFAADGLPPAADGRFTIYIGSFPKREIADRMAQEWKKAGYEAYVTRYQEWNRVSLGRYAKRSDARNEAEKLKDSFENGYWVGELP